VPPIQLHLFLYLSLPNASLFSGLCKLGVFAKSLAVSYWLVSIPRVRISNQVMFHTEK
jgi:hypothetical protein